MDIANKVQASPCVNDNSKTKAGCGCCKPPALDYVEAVVQHYLYPSPQKMEELMTYLPEAADRISELVIDRNLASEGSQPTAEISSSAEPFPPKTLERRTKARPAYKNVTTGARVDDQSSWGAEDTPSDDGKVEEMMCEELEEAYKAPTLKDLASALSGGSNLQNAPGWD